MNFFIKSNNKKYVMVPNYTIITETVKTIKHIVGKDIILSEKKNALDEYTNWVTPVIDMKYVANNAKGSNNKYPFEITYQVKLVFGNYCTVKFNEECYAGAGFADSEKLRKTFDEMDNFQSFCLSVDDIADKLNSIIEYAKHIDLSQYDENTKKEREEEIAREIESIKCLIAFFASDDKETSDTESEKETEETNRPIVRVVKE